MMKQVIRAVAHSSLIALLLTIPCYGALLYDNGVTSTDSYIVSDNSPGADQLIADDFVLSEQDSITSIEWRGTYGRGITPANDNFTILITADINGSPSTTPLYSFQSASVSRSGSDSNYIFSYVADITPTTLSSGSYWLSIFEDLPIDHRWAWVFQFGGNLYVTAPVGIYSIPYRTDFQLFGSPACEPFPGDGNTGGCFPGPGPFPGLPEPSALALLALCLAGLAIGKRRQRHVTVTIIRS